jgi:hypothetical protein
MWSVRFGPLGHRPSPLVCCSAGPQDDGAYLTDGRCLFRVVWPLCSPTHPDMAILEDCKTLCLTGFTATELCAMRLTPVVPANS